MTGPTRAFLAGLCALLLYALPARGAEPITVELDATAASLSEGDVRLAIEKELGRPVVGPESGSPSDVTIGISDQHIVIRVRQANGIVERSVPLPSNLADAPVTVSLIVGNLARDQSAGLGAAAPPPPETAPAPAAAESRSEPRTEAAPGLEPENASPSYRTHWFGVHVAQDLAVVGGNNVCDPNLGQKTANYACFYSGTTDRPFVHTPYPLRDGVATGLVVATTRLLISYEGAPSPWFSIGLRAGYAFRGGPPAAQAPARAADGSVPAFAQGSGGTPFLPAHLELTLRGWYFPLTESLVRAYVQASAGMAQVDAKVEVDEIDCTDHAELGYRDPPDATTAFDECQHATGTFNPGLAPTTKVDAWKKMGQGFVSLGAGGVFMVTERLGVVLNVSVMYMLPASGIVFEPSLGMTVGL